MTDISADRAEAIADVERVINALKDVYRPEGILIWLGSPSTFFDGRRALDLIAAGETDRVLQLVNALATGAYL